MRTKNLRAGLAILAGGLSFVGSATAADIVIDGSFESGTNNPVGNHADGGSASPGIDGGWTTFTTYTYSAGYTLAGPLGSGQVYLRPYTPNTTLSQIDSLTPTLTTTQIDTSQGQYKLSAWFSTYLANNDWSELTLQFLDGGQSPIGSPVVIGSSAFVSGLGTGAGGYRAWGSITNTGLVPPNSRYASLSISSFNGAAGQRDGYVDLVKLDVIAAFTPIQLNSATPANNSTNVSPGAVVNVTLQDGSLPLDNSSVVFTYDGTNVAPSISKVGSVTTVQYDPPGLIPSLSAHTYKIAYNTNGTSVANTTNTFSFTAASWANINLGPPIYLENFDTLTEGTLPTGWTVSNITDFDTVPGPDLNNFHSDSYLDWVVISRSTLSNLWGVNPGGGDFLAVTNVAPNQVINGSLVTNLIDTNFIFAVSDRNDNQKQVQYLFTSDYNLSGKTNVYLSFHSVWIQNQDSIAAVEYSINGGATWLPAQYMLHGADIVLDTNGNFDASNTLAVAHGDVPDLTAATLTGGSYGQFVGVDSNLWSTLSPYFSPRIDDNETESMRVEIIRLAQADNQATVRLRFSTAGTWSWYWGIDELGFYSITATPPNFTAGPTPASQSVMLGNNATITIAPASGTGPFNYQWRRNGVNLPGKTSLSIAFPVVHASDAGTYDVVASNLGGSVTSSPAIFNTFNPFILVTGQWDFNNTNLAATVGQDLQYFDATVQADTTFGTTTDFGIADIGGQPANVMHFVPSVAAWGGYKMFHGATPNGGGAYVNQYTVIYDLYYPSSSHATWRSLFQTATGNNNDGDVFLQNTANSGIGISSVYQGVVTPDTWHRIAFAFDLSGPGTAPVLVKFIDGVKVGQQTTGLSGVDGRFALDPFALLFGDNDGDVNAGYVSSVQFSNGRRSDEFLAALGGPSVNKIPGAIRATQEGGNTVVRWTGGVPLQGADNLTGPWSTVATTSPYTVATPQAKKYYRPKIP